MKFSSWTTALAVLLLLCFTLGVFVGWMDNQTNSGTNPEEATESQERIQTIEAATLNIELLKEFFRSQATDSPLSSRRHLLSVTPGPLSVSPGYYAQLCPAGGYYCPTNNTQPVNCPLGSYCNGTGNSAPTACTTPGTYCPMNSEQPLQCPAGSYCPTTSTIIPCPSGSLCPAGSNAPRPNLSKLRPGLTWYFNSNPKANGSAPGSFTNVWVTEGGYAHSLPALSSTTTDMYAGYAWPIGTCSSPQYLITVQPHSLAGLKVDQMYRFNYSIKPDVLTWVPYYACGDLKLVIYRSNTNTNLGQDMWYGDNSPSKVTQNYSYIPNKRDIGIGPPGSIIAQYDIPCRNYTHMVNLKAATDNNGWLDFSVDFNFTVGMGAVDAMVGIYMAPKLKNPALGKPAGLGSTYETWYWANFSMSLLPNQPQVIPTTLQTGAPNLAQQTKQSMQPTFTDSTSTTYCPHLWTNLTSWSSIVSQVNESQPVIILPNNTAILYGANSNPRNIWWQKIVVPLTTTLVFDDAPFSIHVENILVLGSLRVGDGQCRLQSKIQFYFHDPSTTHPTTAPDPVNDPSCYFCQGFLSFSNGQKGIAAPKPSTSYPFNSSVIELHGYQYLPTWTRLAATIWPGDIFIYLIDSNNWEIGQSIGIATSTYFDEVKPQNEVRTIVSISADGKIIEVDQPMQFHHYSGYEYQTEVALLSRRITFQGYDSDGSTSSSRIGGHIMTSGQLRASGIELYKMGQRNVLGRYPLHWHMTGSALQYAAQGGQFIQDCSFHATYFRCLSIHGTHNATVTRSVGFDITAHCFFIEDGIEQNNTLSYNFAGSIHAILPAANSTGFTCGVSPSGTWPMMCGSGQPGLQIPYGSGLVHASDAAPAGFYITNAQNYIYGNAASGGFTGFSFIGLKSVTGLSLTNNPTYSPINQPTLVFQENTAHSAGYTWDDGGGCLYAGGDLRYNSTLNDFYYDNGRYLHGIVNINHMKVWLCNKGISHWGTGQLVNSLATYLEAHDIHYAANWFYGRIHHGLFNAHSQNPSYNMKSAHGFFFYDTAAYGILVDVELQNYLTSNYTDYPAGVIFTNGNSPTTYVSSAIDGTAQLRWTNVSNDIAVWAQVGAPDGDMSAYGRAASYCFNFADFDGTTANLTKNTYKLNGNTSVIVNTTNLLIPSNLDTSSDYWPIGRPAIMGNANTNTSWWHLDEKCILNDIWQVYICDMTPARKPIQLVFNMAHYISTNQYGPALLPLYERFAVATPDPTYGKILGQMVLFGPGIRQPDRTTPFFNIGVFSGVSGMGWWWNLKTIGGSPNITAVEALYMYPNVTVILAVPYPPGSLFTVSTRTYFHATWIPINNVSTFGLLVNSTVPAYYFDQSNFYLKIFPCPEGLSIVNEGNVSLPLGRLPESYTVTYEWTVRNCSQTSKGFCPTPNPTFPVWDALTCPAPRGFYCSPNSVEATECPIGSYCPGVGNSAPIVCPGGSYCPSNRMESPIQCPLGFYCPQGSGQMIPCPFSYYCPTNSSQPTICTSGSSICCSAVPLINNTQCPSLPSQVSSLTSPIHVPVGSSYVMSFTVAQNNQTNYNVSLTPVCTNLINSTTSSFYITNTPNVSVTFQFGQIPGWIYCYYTLAGIGQSVVQIPSPTYFLVEALFPIIPIMNVPNPNMNITLTGGSIPNVISGNSVITVTLPFNSKYLPESLTSSGVTYQMICDHGLGLVGSVNIWSSTTNDQRFKFITPNTTNSGMNIQCQWILTGDEAYRFVVPNPFDIFIISNGTNSIVNLQSTVTLTHLGSNSTDSLIQISVPLNSSSLPVTNINMDLIGGVSGIQLTAQCTAGLIWQVGSTLPTVNQPTTVVMINSNPSMSFNYRALPNKNIPTQVTCTFNVAQGFGDYRHFNSPTTIQLNIDVAIPPMIITGLPTTGSIITPIIATSISPTVASVNGLNITVNQPMNTITTGHTVSLSLQCNATNGGVVTYQPTNQLVTFTSTTQTPQNITIFVNSIISVINGSTVTCSWSWDASSTPSDISVLIPPVGFNFWIGQPQQLTLITPVNVPLVNGRFPLSISALPLPSFNVSDQLIRVIGPVGVTMDTSLILLMDCSSSVCSMGDGLVMLQSSQFKFLPQQQPNQTTLWNGVRLGPVTCQFNFDTINSYEWRKWIVPSPVNVQVSSANAFVATAMNLLRHEPIHMNLMSYQQQPFMDASSEMQHYTYTQSKAHSSYTELHRSTRHSAHVMSSNTIVVTGQPVDQPNVPSQQWITISPTITSSWADNTKYMTLKLACAGITIPINVLNFTGPQSAGPLPSQNFTFTPPTTTGQGILYTCVFSFGGGTADSTFTLPPSFSFIVGTQTTTYNIIPPNPAVPLYTNSPDRTGGFSNIYTLQINGSTPDSGILTAYCGLNYEYVIIEFIDRNATVPPPGYMTNYWQWIFIKGLRDIQFHVRATNFITGTFMCTFKVTNITNTNVAVSTPAPLYVTVQDRATFTVTGLPTDGSIIPYGSKVTLTITPTEAPNIGGVTVLAWCGQTSMASSRMYFPAGTTASQNNTMIWPSNILYESSYCQVDVTPIYYFGNYVVSSSLDSPHYQHGISIKYVYGAKKNITLTGLPNDSIVRLNNTMNCTSSYNPLYVSTNSLPFDNTGLVVNVYCPGGLIARVNLNDVNPQAFFIKQQGQFPRDSITKCSFLNNHPEEYNNPPDITVITGQPLNITVTGIPTKVAPSGSSTYVPNVQVNLPSSIIYETDTNLTLTAFCSPGGTFGVTMYPLGTAATLTVNNITISPTMSLVLPYTLRVSGGLPVGTLVTIQLSLSNTLRYYPLPVFMFNISSTNGVPSSQVNPIIQPYIDRFESVAMDGSQGVPGNTIPNIWGGHQSRITAHSDSTIRICYLYLRNLTHTPDGESYWRVMKRNIDATWTLEGEGQVTDDVVCLRDPRDDRLHVVTYPNSIISIYKTPNYDVTPVPGIWPIKSSAARQYGNAGIGYDGTICTKCETEDAILSTAKTWTNYNCGNYNSTSDTWSFNSQTVALIGLRHCYDVVFPNPRGLLPGYYSVSQLDLYKTASNTPNLANSFPYAFNGIMRTKGSLNNDSNFFTSQVNEPDPSPYLATVSSTLQLADGFIDSTGKTWIQYHKYDPLLDPGSTGVNPFGYGGFMTVTSPNGNIVWNGRMPGQVYGNGRIFEDHLGRLWFLYSNVGTHATEMSLFSVSLVPLPGQPSRWNCTWGPELKIDTSITFPYTMDGQPFIATVRGGSTPSPYIHIRWDACYNLYPDSTVTGCAIGHLGRVFYMRIRLPD